MNNAPKNQRGLNMPQPQKMQAVDFDALDAAVNQLMTTLVDISESLANIDFSLHALSVIERKRAISDGVLAPDELKEIDGEEEIEPQGPEGGEDAAGPNPVH